MHPASPARAARLHIQRGENVEQNLQALKQAAVLYPLVAILFTLPYVAFNYRKYGSVFSLRILIVYSFALYMLCVYCLVILPLPTREAAKALSGHKAQLTPFNFVADIIKHSQVSLKDPLSFLTLINNPAFLGAAFNLLMTLPLGVYLRYYFRCGWLKTLLTGFGLSLFFELTQLTGLYFIYPGSYRLFDVDDLMINTLGTMVGFWLARPLTRWLPSRDRLDSISLERGRRVSLLRRMLAMAYDLAICGVLAMILCQILRIGFRFWFVALLQCAGPILLRGQTVGCRLTRLRLQKKDGSRPEWYRYLIRYGSMALVMVYLPNWLLRLIGVLRNENHFSASTTVSLTAALIAGYMGCLLFEVIRVLMHRSLFYERLSGAYIVSTVRPTSQKE